MDDDLPFYNHHTDNLGRLIDQAIDKIWQIYKMEKRGDECMALSRMHSDLSAYRARKAHRDRILSQKENREKIEFLRTIVNE